MKQSFYVSIITLIQLLSALLFQFFILKTFGMTESLDVFYASSTISVILITVSTSGLNYVLTPIVIRLRKRKAYSKLNRLISTYINLSFIIFVFFSLIQISFRYDISSVLFPGYTAGKNTLLAQMLAIQSISLVFGVLVGVINSLNFACNQLYRTAALPLLSLVCQYFCILVLHDSLDIISVAFSSLVYQISLFLLLSIGHYKKYKPVIIFDKVFLISLARITPLFLSSAFSRSDLLVNRYLASSLSTGFISSLHFGLLAINVLSSIVNKGLALVSLRYFSSNMKLESSRDFELLIEFIMAISVSVSLIIMVTIEPTLNLLLLERVLNETEVARLTFVIIMLLGYFIGGSLSSIIVNPFYSKGLTIIVSRVSIILQTLSILTMYISFDVYGFYSLPIIMSIKSIVNSFILLTLYHFYIYKVNYSRLFACSLFSVVTFFSTYYIVVYSDSMWIISFIPVLLYIVFSTLKNRRLLFQINLASD